MNQTALEDNRLRRLRLLADMAQNTASANRDLSLGDWTCDYDHVHRRLSEQVSVLEAEAARLMAEVPSSTWECDCGATNGIAFGRCWTCHRARRVRE